VHYSIIDYVHKHKIKISEVKKYGLERTRWRLAWTMARKRPVQLLAALAETRLVVRQRSMLVALYSKHSDNHSTGSHCHTACLYSGSQRTGNSHVGESSKMARTNTGANQKTVRRAQE
jgi:hypothetical protein